MKLKNRYIGWILTILIVAIFFIYLFTHLDDFKSLLTINPLFLAALLVVLFCGVLTNGLFLKWSIILFGKKIKTVEAIKVSLISTIGNFFAPGGSGLGLRAIYLKKQHGLAYSHYLSIVFCNYVIGFSVNSLIGIGALYLLGAYTTFGGKVLGLFFLVILILSFISFFIRFRVKIKPGIIGRIFNILNRVSEGWGLMLAHKNRALMLVVITVTNSLLLILGAYLITRSLSIEISIPSLLLFSVIGSFSIFINITPGNLGIKEVIYIMLATTIGLTTPQILSIALVDRSVMFIMILILSATFGKNLTRFKDTSINPTEKV